MHSRFGFLLTCALLAAATLSACAVPPPAADGRESLYTQRQARLGGVAEWILEGRLAVNDSEDGGSGELRWRQVADRTRMDFHGALGRGAWRLEAEPDEAVLTFADGRQSRAASIDALVRTEVGWAVPVESLAWWVRGLAAPGTIQGKELDEAGRLSELLQDGWSIEFARYGAVGAEDLPMRMTARQDGRTVKLAVRRWQIAVSDEPR